MFYQHNTPTRKYTNCIFVLVLSGVLAQFVWHNENKVTVNTLWPLASQFLEISRSNSQQPIFVSCYFPVYVTSHWRLEDHREIQKQDSPCHVERYQMGPPQSLQQWIMKVNAVLFIQMKKNIYPSFARVLKPQDININQKSCHCL